MNYLQKRLIAQEIYEKNCISCVSLEATWCNSKTDGPSPGGSYVYKKKFFNINELEIERCYDWRKK